MPAAREGMTPKPFQLLLGNARANSQAQGYGLEPGRPRNRSQISFQFSYKGFGCAWSGERRHIYHSNEWGAPAGGLKTTVDNYVTSYTQFGVMPVTVQIQLLFITNIAATITVRTGFVSATVQKLVKFAMALASCEMDNEIMNIIKIMALIYVELLK